MGPQGRREWNPLIPEKLILETQGKKPRLSIQFFQNNLSKQLQSVSHGYLCLL